MLWETGEISTESLEQLAEEIPVELAFYAKKKGLLEQDGWKQFKRIANREKHVTRLIKQAKLRSFRTSPRFKYGYEVPKNYADATRLYKKIKNTRWMDANKLEHKQLSIYDVFQDMGLFNTTKIPKGYRKIRVHTIYDVKHDGNQ